MKRLVSRSAKASLPLTPIRKDSLATCIGVCIRMYKFRLKGRSLASLKRSPSFNSNFTPALFIGKRQLSAIAVKQKCLNHWSLLLLRRLRHLISFRNRPKGKSQTLHFKLS